MTWGTCEEVRGHLKSQFSLSIFVWIPGWNWSGQPRSARALSTHPPQQSHFKLQSRRNNPIVKWWICLLPWFDHYTNLCAYINKYVQLLCVESEQNFKNTHKTEKKNPLERGDGFADNSRGLPASAVRLLHYVFQVLSVDDISVVMDLIWLSCAFVLETC